jgi:hypothetical protein
VTVPPATVGSFAGCLLSALGQSRRVISRWSFSLQLLVLYLAVFHLWRVVERPAVVATGLAMTVLLGVLFARAARTGYFHNQWDGFWHATVILDILLEATLIPAHGHVGFYLCAAAFVVVVGGYRALLSRRRATER